MSKDSSNVASTSSAIPIPIEDNSGAISSSATQTTAGTIGDFAGPAQGSRFNVSSGRQIDNTRLGPGLFLNQNMLEQMSKYQLINILISIHNCTKCDQKHEDVFARKKKHWLFYFELAVFC